MRVLLAIVAIATAIRIYSVIAYHYGFKNWDPLCGCKVMECTPKIPS